MTSGIGSNFFAERVSNSELGHSESNRDAAFRYYQQQRNPFINDSISTSTTTQDQPHRREPIN